MKTLHRDIAMRLAAVLAFGLCSAAPAAAQEANGGAEATVDRPGLMIRPAALLDRTLALRGRTDAGDAGRPVRFELQLPDRTWRPIAATTVGPEGFFGANWKADTAGRITLRAIVERPADSAVAAAEPLVAQVTIFKPAVASWYGPGFFGRKTACGQTLTRRTVGVAHKTLPCGTQVEIYHQGRTVTVPVIDRGPFRPGRDWDLTQATAESLGVKATVRVGALHPEPTPFRPARKRPRR